AGQVRELPFEEVARVAGVSESVLEGVEGERRCGGCGAMVQMPANVAADTCPFCASHLTNPIESPKPVMRPGGILPFTIGEDDARRRFKEWVKGRWFAPGELRRMAQLNRLAGLYVPYWTYDAMTWSFFAGERGDHYWVTVGTGKNQHRVRRTRWTSVQGRVDQWFDDVLVCGSKSLPREMADDLEPWDLKMLQPFSGEYLGGFRTERYQVGAPEGFVEARAKMDQIIARLARRQIGGDEQRVHSIQTQVSGVTFKHLLLPLWLSAYRFRNRPYRVLVNARTGEVQGERPWSWVKITFAALAGAIAVAAIILALMSAQAR
ncbi:primosomal protein N' (replication factor Y) - superfamily II helicase, partial [Candidatus Poribacteria bacterium]|nr:primosomal protein N' (replication factor Y) - superfamily II helicase [Candidatus Poribacteria bacterium]